MPANPSPDVRRRWPLLFIAALALFLAACSEPESRSAIDIVMTGPNSAVVIGEEYFQRSTDDGGRTWREDWVYGDEADGYQRDGFVTDLCVTAQHCLRIADEDTLLESLDGGDSWNSVWSIDDDKGWIDATHGEGRPLYAIGPTDIAAFDDGVVLVAMGDIEPLRRDIDGTWSMTTYEFRRLSPGWLTAGALAAMAMLVSLIAIVGLGRQSRVFRLGSQGVVFSVVPFIAIIRGLFIDGGQILSAGIWWNIVALLAVPALLTVLGQMLLRTVGFGRQVMWANVGAQVAVFALMFGAYNMWRRDWIGEVALVSLWLLAIAIGVALGTGLMRNRPTAPPHGQPLNLVEPPPTPAAG